MPLAQNALTLLRIKEIFGILGHVEAHDPTTSKGDHMPITIPPVPAGLHPAGCWRRMLTGLDLGKVGGYRVLGPWLHAGDEVELPDGALIVAVDKATRGWETGYRTWKKHPVEDSTVTAYLVAGDVLSEVWSRQYISSKSAFGATTTKKLARLLAEHPVPDGEAVVVREARRPNLKRGTCRWCVREIPAELGHTVRVGADLVVEHFEDCPTSVPSTGELCARCGVAVVNYQAARHYLRDGSGKTEVRHKAVDGGTCWENPVPSPQEQQAAAQERNRAVREEAAREQAVKDKQQAARRARAEAKRAREEEAHRVEQERVAQLATVSRASRNLFDKGLGGDFRARLDEHTDTLSDGTTTVRWTVSTYLAGGASGYGEDGDVPDAEAEEFTRLADARSSYRGKQFTPMPRRSSSGGGRTCAECGRPGAQVEREDSSGIPGYVCFRCDRANPDDFMLSFA